MKVKKITLILALFMVLVCCLGAVSASEDAGSDIAASDDVSVDEAVGEIDSNDESISANEQADNVDDSNSALSAQQNNDTSSEPILEEQNNEETLKSGTNTLTVNNINELKTKMTNALNDAENDTYVINLNPGTYKITSNINLNSAADSNKINFIINGNNQELTANTNRYIRFNNGCNVTINNLKITAQIQNYQNNNLILKNCSLNSRITNQGILTICDDVKLQQDFFIAGNGKVITNKTEIAQYMDIYNGDYILENVIITSSKTNYGNLTIRNSTINNRITNYGKLSIADDVIFGENFRYTENEGGEIIINDTDKLTLYLTEFKGNYIIENITINDQRNNYGNLTFINVTLNAFFTNNGNLTLKNCTINTQITNNGILTIDDDVIFGNSFYLAGEGKFIINDFNRILPYLSTYDGDYLLENLSDLSSKTNKGNLTIRNSTIIGTITNNGNLTIENSSATNTITNKGELISKNSTVNRIQNTGTVIIDDDVIFGPNFYISGGNVIVSDYNKIFPYIGQFKNEATVQLGDYNNIIMNYGNLTIVNTTFNEQVLNSNPGKLTIINSTTNTNKPFSNSGIMEFINCTINTKITNTGILIISEDTILGENFQIAAGYGGVEGQVITNNTQLIDYVDIYKGDIVLSNKTIKTPKTNKGRLTLNNCTINSTISNDGIIIIDEDTVFGENAKIAGTGEIKINDLSRILPIIDTINGNYEIKDTELTKNYAFNGDVTLINCTITNPDNTNFGTLKLNNCTVNVGEEDTFLINYGTVIISKDTKIIGKIVDLVDGVIYEGAPKTYIITQDTIGYFFDEAGLTSIVNPGDTLNIQGTIKLNRSLTIDKPVNIISTTNDAYIDLNTTAGDYFGSNQGNKFAITKDGAYTNVTGIYFHNTQLWLFNTDHVTLDGISAVVENQRVGSGVGVTSIRQNSSYITVKNSYFYTKDNEGSSTLVLAWANYCTIENNTIVGVGNVGNLLYLTTYNVNIPQGSMFNSHNKLINNRITGPESAAICYGICLTGYDNLVDNNTITYSGAGITSQWGSGVTGIEQAESLVGSGENIVSNNKLYGGCGISAGDLIYNNYMEGTLAVPANSIAYNNTAKGLELMGNASEVSNSTIAGQVTFADGVTNAIVENNNITGDITIPATATKNTLKGNDIKGQVILDGSDNTITNNTIVSGSDYAISSNKLGKNNNITANEVSANGKTGNDAISLRDPSNIVAGNVAAKTAEPTGDNGTKPVTPTKPTTPAKTTTKKVTKKATKIIAKNKKFKAKTKVKKYTITLKAGKNPVKKVQVTIKIGKKTYKAKTNNKGKATFKIKKLTKKGKYKAVIKFKGNKNYKASSKKVKITIK